VSAPSKPLLGVLAAVVIVAVLWTVALQPGSGNGGAGSRAGGLGSYQGAIDKARTSAAAQNRAAAATGNQTSTTASPGGSAGAASTPPASSAHHAAAEHPASSADHAPAARLPAPARVVPAGPRGPAEVNAALRAGHAVALLFYNAGAADDVAVRAELQSIPASRRLLRLAVPVSQVAAYPAISLPIQIDSAPTLVIVDRAHRASIITGYASSFEIAHRVAAALAVRP
jgi:hypothetical protein